MKHIFLITALALAAALPALAAAEDMKPNKDPVPSPSDLRGATGEDRPQGSAREDRTPSPSDLATEAPRVDGDRRTDALQRPSTAGSGGSARPLPENNRGEPIRP